MTKTRNHASHKQHRQHRSIIFALSFIAVVAIALITFVAINCHRPDYRDDLSDLKQYSNADHGATLQEFVQGVKDENCEYLGIFNLKGEKLLEYTTNSAVGVELPPDIFWRIFGDFNRKSLISVHNHPGSHEPSFSSIDIKGIICDSPYVEEIVVTNNQVHILRPGAKGWPTIDAAKAFLKEVELRLNAGELVEHFELDEPTGYLFAKDSFAQFYADRFGLSFDVTPIDSFNFADWAP